jgi:lipopolysaccharide export system protein LptA
MQQDGEFCVIFARTNVMVVQQKYSSVRLHRYWGILLLLCMGLLISSTVFAQNKNIPARPAATTIKKISIIRADKISFTEKQGYQVLRGNVLFEHDSTYMHCDSAHLDLKTNSFRAFSNIRVLKGDSISLVADTLYYYGNTKTADLLGRITYIDRQMELKAPSLNYDMNTDIGRYDKGAVIKSVGDTNVLTSTIGIYESVNQQLYFKNKVKLTNPTYVMDSDTLLYNVASKIAMFYGPTNIVSKENRIYCERGWYDTENEISSLWKKPEIYTKEQYMRGDSIHYNRTEGIGKVYGNVFFKDTTQKIEGKGRYAYHNEINDSTVITQQAVLTQFYEKDTLYVKSDIITIKNDTVKDERKIWANGAVRIFKSDLQAKCDSLHYNERDSLMHFVGSPVLWSDKNQITGEYIVAKTAEGNIVKMEVTKNSFIISSIDSTYYNQIKGKNLIAYFAENKISRVNIIANCESLYFLKDEGGPVNEANKALSSRIVITFVDEEIQTIRFDDSPNAVLKDVLTLSANELRLEGFTWLDDERPIRIEFYEMPQP